MLLGLEFNVVYLPGWEEEVLSSSESIEEKGENGLEEEETCICRNNKS